MKRILLCLFAVAAIPATPASAGFECYLRIGTIQGEATAEGHTNEITVQSFAFDLSHAAGSVAQRSDFVFTKPLDKASPVLALKCADGTSYPDAILTCRSSDPTRPIFYRITLVDVQISRVAVEGTAAAQNRPNESVTLRFNRVRWEYYPILPDGSQGALVRQGWDFQAQRPY